MMTMMMTTTNRQRVTRGCVGRIARVVDAHERCACGVAQGADQPVGARRSGSQSEGAQIDLSELFESSLEQAIREAEQHAWLAANGEAIEAYNAALAKRGVFSERWRRF